MLALRPRSSGRQGVEDAGAEVDARPGCDIANGSWRAPCGAAVRRRGSARDRRCRSCAAAAAGSTSLSGRLKSSGTSCSETPPCERSGASRPERSWRDGLVPITKSRSETTTTSPMRSGGSSNCAAASARVSTSSTPGTLRSFADEAGEVGAGRQVGRGERAERAVVRDVRIGHRQDHARRARADLRVEPVLQVDDLRRAGGVGLGVHAVVGGERDGHAHLRRAAPGSRSSSGRSRWPPACPGACLCCT